MSDSIGNQLNEARAQKGYSLEHISQLTRIKIRYLEAIESDQFEILASPVQIKGFLRLYADAVGIPSQQLIDIYTGNTEKPSEPPLTPLPIQEPDPQPDSIEPVSANKLSNLLKKRPSKTTQPSPAEPAKKADSPSLPAADSPSVSIFKSIGETIRTRRETLGLSLSDIEEYIHVRPYYLKLIEEGNFQELPSTVQARGMLNNYVGFLDLDAENMMLRFAEGIQAQYTEKTGRTISQAQPKTVKTQAPAWKKYVTTDLLFGGLVVLGLLGFTIWGAVQLSSSFSNKPQSSSGSISAALIETTTGSATPTGTPEGNNSKISPGEKPANVSAQTEEGAPETEPTATLVFSGAGPLQINVISRQRAWVRITVDGAIAFEGRVLPGNAYPYSGNQQIEVVTGNAGALSISYLLNGTETDMGVLGTTGEVKSLIFTNQGVTTPTPKFTMTATPTSQPTLTIQPSPTPIKPSVTPYVP